MESIVAVSQADIAGLGVHPRGLQEGAELHAGRADHIGPIALLHCALLGGQGFIVYLGIALNRRHRLPHHFTGRGGAAPLRGCRRPTDCSATRTQARQLLFHPVQALHQVRRYGRRASTGHSPSPTTIGGQQGVGQGQFQTLPIGGAGEAGLLLVQRSLQFQETGNIRAVQPSFLAQTQFGVQGRAQRRDQSLHHCAGREAVAVQPPGPLQGRARVARDQRRRDCAHALAGGQAQRLLHPGPRNGAARRQHALQQALAVAHGSVGQPPDQVQGITVGSHALLDGQTRQFSGDFLRRQAAKAVMLAAREDGGNDLFRLGGGQNENDVAGRLLQGFEERIEGALGHHVRLVQNVDLLAAAHGRQADQFTQFSHIVHAIVAGRVDFHHVGVGPGAHADARLALAAGFGVRASAVGGHGDQARGGGLAHAARPAKEVGVAHAPSLQCSLQHVFDVFLAHHLIPADRAGALVDGTHTRTSSVTCGVRQVACRTGKKTDLGTAEHVPLTANLFTPAV
ncbi:hypothetical protein DESA109040_11700 [Deinococcus saxicola]